MNTIEEGGAITWSEQLELYLILIDEISTIPYGLWANHGDSTRTNGHVITFGNCLFMVYGKQFVLSEGCAIGYQEQANVPFQGSVILLGLFRTRRHE